jgi:hypothetical protein
VVPSALGLQLLENVCKHYGFKHDILYHGPVGRQLYSYTGPPAFHNYRIFTCSFCTYIVCIVDVGNKVYSIPILSSHHFMRIGFTG